MSLVQNPTVIFVAAVAACRRRLVLHQQKEMVTFSQKALKKKKKKHPTVIFPKIGRAELTPCVAFESFFVPLALIEQDEQRLQVQGEFVDCVCCKRSYTLATGANMKFSHYYRVVDWSRVHAEQTFRLTAAKQPLDAGRTDAR